MDWPSTHQHCDRGKMVCKRFPELRKETLEAVTR